MAVVRMASHRSDLMGSLCPSTFARFTRQLVGERISIATYRSLGPQANVGLFTAATSDLKPNQWGFLIVKGRRTATSKSTVYVRVAEWKDARTPYETLDVTRDAKENEIKSSYRRLAKHFHPDVYDNNTGGLKDGESPEAKFIKIQAAYELLMDKDQRRQYDVDHRINPMQASEAWMNWVFKKKRAFEQRGDMAASVWAEHQQREISVKARRLAKHKMDPEEERQILAKERRTMSKTLETTLNRHTLVLKKRELTRRKDTKAENQLVQQLLAAEGLELEDEKCS